MLETAVQLESDPPEMATSASTKSVEDSERVKVIVGVSPLLRDARFELMAMVGGVVSAVVVSMENMSELLASAPSWLVLEAELEKAAEATEMRPSEVLSAVGVNVAV